MTRFAVAKARGVLVALQRIGWRVKRQSGWRRRTKTLLPLLWEKVARRAG